MRVSVIVPVYNVEKYLNQCIDSVLCQTYNDFELILVDDGSIDASSMICDNYANIDNRVKVIHQSNCGVSVAWVTGVKISQGEYIIGLDSDDYWDNNLLERCILEVDNYCCDMVVFGYKDFDKGNIHFNKLGVDGGVYQGNNLNKIYNKLINGGSISMRSSIYLSRINKLIRRSIVLNNLKYYIADFYFGEDNLYAISNTLDCKIVSILANYYPYYYRMNYNSITHSYHPDLNEQFNKLDNYVLTILNDKGYNELINQVLCDSVFHAIISINNAMRSGKSNKEIISQIKEIISYSLVRSGTRTMNKKLMTFRENMNVFLIRCKMARIIYLLKK